MYKPRPWYELVALFFGYWAMITIGFGLLISFITVFATLFGTY